VRRVAVTAVVLALLGGTAAAFAVTEALKLEYSPVNRPRFDRVFSPTCACETSVASLSFRLRRSDRLDLAIVSGDTTVRTLADGVEYPRGRVRVEWDGRDDSGAIVPDGPYRLRVDLAEAGRTIVIPKDVLVDTQPPQLEIVDAGPRIFSPDGDGRRDEVAIVYRADEDTAPSMLVDGRLAGEGKLRRRRERTVTWNGELSGRPAREGTYVVSLGARDAAGNVSTPVEALAVRIRYVDVVPAVTAARRGARLHFRIVTDALAVSWRLRRRSGRVVLADDNAQPGRVAVRLPDAIRPGSYVFEVVANGHKARVAVRILKRRA
jgi:hypothetical protein